MSVAYAVEMTPEEIRKHEEQVTYLYASFDLTRNIAAVLMDTLIGAGGDGEDRAMQKAAAIVGLLRAKGQLTPRADP